MPQVSAAGDHLLLESEKEMVEEPPQPTQQELVVKASHDAGFSNTIGIGQCSGQDRNAILTEDGLHQLAKNWTNRDLWKDPG